MKKVHETTTFLLVTLPNTVFEKRAQQLKKRNKSRFLNYRKKRRPKKRTGMYMYSFKGHLITPVFNTQLPKVSIGRPSHRHQTSENILS